MSIVKIFRSSTLASSVIVICCVALSNYVHGQSFSFERAIPGKLSETTIFSIVQDHQGFIWYATLDGLWKFDGHNTTEYRYNPADTTSISSSIARALLVDRQGNLWVGTTGGGLNKYIPEYDHFERYMYAKNDPSTLSHNDVLYIYQDKYEEIWVCTEDGFNRLDKETGSFTRYYLEENPLPGQYNRSFLTCLEDSDGNFWVGSFYRGLFLFDRQTGKYEHIDLNNLAHGRPEYPNLNLWSLSEDSKGRLWIGTHRQGLLRYGLQTGDIKHFHTQEDTSQRLSDNIIYTIHECKSGLMWIGTDNGLNVIDEENQQITQYFSSLDNPSSISNNSIRAIMEDNTGTIWLGGWEGFADKCDKKSKRFVSRVTMGVADPMPVHYNSILEDSRGRLLVGTNSGLMVIEDFDKFDRGSHIEINPDQPVFYQGDYVFSIVEDNSGYIWVATNTGLRKFRNNPRNSTIYTTSENAFSLSSSYITTLFIDSQNTLWVGTQNGLNEYIRDNDSFIRYPWSHFNPGSLSHKFVYCIYEDRDGTIWVGTHNGLNRLDKSAQTFTNYQHEHNNANTLANGYVNVVYQDSRGLIWIGTSAGLSYALDHSGHFRSFSVMDGLPGNIVLAIHEDDSGYLWISTNEGISRLKLSFPQTSNQSIMRDSLELAFWNFSVSDGLVDVGFKRNSVTRISNGEILFGSTLGICSIVPENIINNTYIPPVVLTDLKIHNRTVRPEKGSKLLEKHIGLVKGITLNYKQSVITLDYVALNYTNSYKNQYAYIMKGFDHDWIMANARRSTTYTNLNPGKYVFMVKASNNDGIWNEEGAVLEVTVLPPPWKTWPAFFIYVFILSATVFGFAQLAMAKQKAEGRLKIQKLESDKIMEMNYFKSVFFTNISHEFRTPLTLIISPLSDILKDSNLSDSLVAQVKLIQKNAMRLLRLINQLLDISKVEAGHITLKVAKGNIVEFVNAIFDAFSINAGKENIKYRFYASHDEITCYFDGDKIEKILYNLLSNAFKHTPSGGKIDVLLFQKRDEANRKFIELIVHDSGPGIAPDKQKRIFERYFVLSESESPWQSSTGIGLSLANQLTLIHKGNITLESREGEGSRFLVNIPVYPEAFSSNEIMPEMPVLSNKLEQVRMLIDYESTSIHPVAIDDKNLPISLLVEDNKDVSDYIKERLSGHYKVLTAYDGRQGYEIAVDKIPDIIISDVMMPEMDGFEFCRKVKSDEKTSHIPVILLTARASEDNLVEGYEMGADGYIPKPFQMARLMAQMRNLIDSRNKLRDIFGKRLMLEPGEVSLNSIDENFIQKAIGIIEKQIAEPELNVEVLCNQIGMSRSQAFRKIKAITALSPVELIRMIRVKRAAQLMEKKCGTISEIAYMVGFSDLDYFRKCFKEQFGVTPSKYIENMSGNTSE